LTVTIVVLTQPLTSVPVTVNVVCAVGIAVTELVLLVSNDAPVHAYVDAPVADNVVVPPDTTDAGDAAAVTVGNEFNAKVRTLE
jgi:hypothetical protein